MNIKKIMWSFGLLPVNKCPNCHNQLLQHYDNLNEGEHTYTCNKEVCTFNQ